MPSESAISPSLIVHLKAVTYLNLVAGIAGGVSAIATKTVGWNVWLWAAVAFVVVTVLCLPAYHHFLALAYRSTYRGIIHRNSQLNQLLLVGARQPAGPTLHVGDVYIDVQLSTKQPGGRDQPGFGPTPSGGGHRLKLDELLHHSDSSAFSIRGRPGDGKTTLLRATAIKLTEPGRVLRPLPVLIMLPRHAEAIAGDESVGLAEVAMTEPWLSTSVITVEHMRKWLRGRRVVVMFDGLDEVDEAHRAKVVKWVDRVRGGNFRGSLAIAGRPLGFNAAMLAQAPIVLDICSLSRTQMRLFIKKCFSAARRRGRDKFVNASSNPAALLAQLDDNPHLFDLAMTPLMLHIIIYRDIYLPWGMVGSKAQLYDEFIEILLHSRRSLEGAGETSTDPVFLQKLAVMRQLAFELMVEQDRYFHAQERITKILNQLRIEDNAQKLADTVRKHGLVITVDGTNAAFAHLSFQEYLAASHIVDADFSDLLIENISSGWWRNTTILWAAQTDPEPVITACQRKGGGDAWELAIACANEADTRGFSIGALLSSRIEDFLELDHPPKSDEYLVACTEVIRRNLQQIEPLNDESLVCKAPVKMPLWRLREKSELRKKRFPSVHRQGPDHSLRGLWPSEVEGFLNWLNRFDHRGFTYRLPSTKEGSAILRSRWNNRVPVGIWVQGRNGIVPQYRGNDRGGFTASEAALGRLLGADWSDTVGLLGPLQGPVGTAQRNAVRQVGESLHHLLESVVAAQEAVRSHIVDRAEYAGQTQAAQEQSTRIDRLLAQVRTLAENIQTGTDLVTALELVHGLRGGVPVQPGIGLTPLHVSQIKQRVNALRGSILTTYDKSFQDLYSRIKVRQQQSASPLKSAAALLLAPALALEGGQGLIPDPISVSSSRHVAERATGEAVYPEQVLSELERLHDLIRSGVRGMRNKQVAKMFVEIVADVRSVITPSLKREVKLDRAALRVARLALVGLVTRFRAESGESGALECCCRCIAGLAVIEMRTSGELTLNEAIVFVREDR